MTKLSDFDFDLPESLIARHPSQERDGGRLLVVDRSTGTLHHASIRELPSFLSPGDLLVANDTRVIKARLQTEKVATGGKVEVLLIEPVSSPHLWRVMIRASKPLKAGRALRLLGQSSPIHVHAVEGEGFAILRFEEDPLELAQRFGSIPLPPYLARPAEPEDDVRYQTIFARADAQGSVAAPTAGLHFTETLLAALKQRGIDSTQVTLHVGPGTFLPIRTDQVEDHRMHRERFEVSLAAADRINASKRVVAVGTTVTRVLETVGRPVKAMRSFTELFIRPGFDFRVLGGLMTNFHLPRSTLLMLVSAFAGRELILEAYRQAVAKQYRFYSYGDAMLIL